jgi:hypothetical protein
MRGVVFILLRCGGYRACDEICGEHIVTVTTVGEYFVLTFIRLEEQQ